jgi:hypothetical protein
MQEISFYSPNSYHTRHSNEYRLKALLAIHKCLWNKFEKNVKYKETPLQSRILFVYYLAFISMITFRLVQLCYRYTSTFYVISFKMVWTEQGKNVMILRIPESSCRMFMICMIKIFPVLALSVTVPTDFIGSVL